MYRFKQQIWLTAALLLTLTACGGGGDSTTATATETVSTGVFIDSAVEGLQYETATQSGTTNSLGEYDYLAGETVTFSIGGIVLGSTIAGPVVTPLSLVPGATSATNPIVTNIVRLLLSLDSDGDPDDGITISSDVTTAANDLTVDFSVADLSADEGITSLLNNLPTIILVSESVAQNHFNQTLAVQAKSTWGSLVWGSNAWRSYAEPAAPQ
jgi:hypothetical protein